LIAVMRTTASWRHREFVEAGGHAHRAGGGRTDHGDDPAEDGAREQHQQHH